MVLDALASQLYYRCREASFEVAAVGFAHLAQGDSPGELAFDKILSLLDRQSQWMRCYGGQRFDPSSTDNVSQDDDAWGRFRGYTYVIPLVEYLYVAESDSFFLCVNVAPSADTATVCSVLQSLAAPPLAAPPSLVPPASHSIDLTSFRQWDDAMGHILRQIQGGEYDKIVLARRKRFVFKPEGCPDPLAIIAALRHPLSTVAAVANPSDLLVQDHAFVTDVTKPGGDGSDRIQIDCPRSRGSYLFCLQLSEDCAFLGSSPERLFKVDGDQLRTHALAGTVRRGKNEEDDAAVVAELCSEKNLEEHRFVIEYICDALRRASLKVESEPTRIIKLPRLMHLSTEIHGSLGGPPRALADGVTWSAEVGRRLTCDALDVMHPTPAVCGMPRERTLQELRGLERFDRGLYAGPFGWFSHTRSDFSVAIRSALVHDNFVTAFAGSGIVHESTSLSEWDETELKLSAFTEMFGPCPVLSSHSSVHQNGSLFAGPIEGSSKASPNGHLHGENDSSGNGGCAPDGVLADGSLSQRFLPANLEMEPNLNTLWGSVVVEELCRCGITTFFVSPGSRSAPLAIAAVRSRHAKVHVAHDERGAGFMALGHARGSGLAAAVITSSGTAVANLLPAVVEAHNDEIPMLLLTADRPPELRDVGANQAIDQMKIFGSYVRWFKDMPCPTDDIPIESVLNDVDYAVHMSGCSFSASGSTLAALAKGPVHVNFMFREKLAPDEQRWSRSCVKSLRASWTHGVSPFTCYEPCMDSRGHIQRLLGSRTRLSTLRSSSVVGYRRLRGDVTSEVAAAVQDAGAGVIVLGGTGNNTEDRIAACRFAEALGWPVFADIACGERLQTTCANIVANADALLSIESNTEIIDGAVVIQFGTRLTSKRLISVLRSAELHTYALVSPARKRHDESSRVTHRVCTSGAQFVACISALVLNDSADAADIRGGSRNRARSHSSWPSEARSVKGVGFFEEVWRPLDLAATAYLALCMEQDITKGRMVEPWAARVISKAIPSHCALFIGNSMPIRDLDAFGALRTSHRSRTVSANRGASGIDGIVSTAIGFACGTQLPVVLVVGDMSLLHDLNAFHALRSQPGSVACPPIAIVAINNGGGAIFSMLPVAKHRDVFTPIFDTPHNVNFDLVASTFGVRHVAVRTLQELEAALQSGDHSHKFIEVRPNVDHESTAAHRRQILRGLKDHLSHTPSGNLTRKAGSP